MYHTIFVCLYIHMYACLNIHMHHNEICKFVYACVSHYICVSVCSSLRMFVCTYISQRDTYLHVCMRMASRLFHRSDFAENNVPIPMGVQIIWRLLRLQQIHPLCIRMRLPIHVDFLWQCRQMRCKLTIHCIRFVLDYMSLLHLNSSRMLSNNKKLPMRPPVFWWIFVCVFLTIFRLYT